MMNPTGLTYTKLMHVEWEAWREVCKELSKLGIDINKEDLLAGRICEWGEWLARLRRDGDPAHYDGGLETAQLKVQGALRVK